jgi:hypothetical protein
MYTTEGATALGARLIEHAMRESKKPLRSEGDVKKNIGIMNWVNSKYYELCVDALEIELDLKGVRKIILDNCRERYAKYKEELKVYS